jgi:hypothetical protein
MAVIAMAAIAPPEGQRADPLRQVTAIPMTWRIERGIEAASAQKACTIVSLGGDVRVQMFEQDQAKVASWSVRVGFDNQPGSLRYLRVNRKIFQTDQESFAGDEARKIVEGLKSPGEFAFEWAKRPDSAKRPGLFGTGDFAVKFAECEGWMQGPRV